MAAAVLAVGAFIPLPAQAPPTSAPDRVAAAAEFESVLSARARAVLTRDEAAFLASVDPAAPPAFRQQQRDLFRNLAEVPLAVWDFDVQRGSGQYPARPEVVLNYALLGVDAVPTSRPMGFAFSERGGRWYISDDSRARGQAWRGPWDFGACRVIRTPHGLVIGHDRTAALAGRMARELDSAVDAVTAVWGPEWTQRVGVLLPRSEDELRALVGSEFAVEGIAAVAVADSVDVAAKRVEGPRVVLNTGTAERLSDTSLRVVLRHEIAHVAARAHTAEGAPMWLLEGFADYVGYRGSGLPPGRIAPDLARQVRAGTLPDGPPADGNFDQAGRRLDLAYQLSWSLVDHLVRRIGEPRMVQLYRRIAGAGSPEAVEPALRELAGTSTAALITTWQSSLRTRFR